MQIQPAWTVKGVMFAHLIRANLDCPSRERLNKSLNLDSVHGSTGSRRPESSRCPSGPAFTSLRVRRGKVQTQPRSIVIHRSPCAFPASPASPASGKQSEDAGVHSSAPVRECKKSYSRQGSAPAVTGAEVAKNIRHVRVLRLFPPKQRGGNAQDERYRQGFTECLRTIREPVTYVIDSPMNRRPWCARFLARSPALLIAAEPLRGTSAYAGSS